MIGDTMQASGLSSYRMNFLGSPARMELVPLNMSLQMQMYVKNLIRQTNTNRICQCLLLSFLRPLQ